MVSRAGGSSRSSNTGSTSNVGSSSKNQASTRSSNTSSTARTPSSRDSFSTDKPAATSGLQEKRSGVQRTVAATAAASSGVAQATGTATARTVERSSLTATATATVNATATATGATATAAVTPTQPTPAALPNEFTELREQLANAGGRRARQAAANNLAGWTRENLVNREQLDAYLSRTDVSAEQKSRTLGQLALEMNRSELVLGRSHIGGDAPWEHRGKNQGDFVNAYQTTARNSRTDAWCTKFATQAYQRLGMDLDRATGGKTSPFLSGMRLEAWAERGLDNQNRRLVSEGQTLASDRTSGMTISGNDWSQLTRSLNAAPEADRLQAVNDFMQEHGTPRAGDIIVRDSRNNVHGSSHTLMVESYDPETGRLHTIEGNAGNRVAGFSYDLTNPQVAAQMGFLGRMGPEQFASQTPGNGIPAGSDRPVSAEDLIGQAQRMNASLVDLAAQNGWVHSADPNASSAVLSTGGHNAWTPRSGTSTR